MTKKSKEDIHYKKNKANKKTKSNNVSARNKNNELFDFDKEIVIGMPRIQMIRNEKQKKLKKQVWTLTKISKTPRRSLLNNNK